MIMGVLEMRNWKANRILIFAIGFLLFSSYPLAADAQNRQQERRARQIATEGDKQFRQKNYRVAIDHYAQAIALAPRVPEPRFWKGMAHYYLDEYDMALPELDSALTGGYEKPLDVYLTRWRIHYARKNYDQALADIRSGLTLDKDNTAFQLALGDISLARGEYQAALDGFNAYLVTNPTNAEVHLNIARSHAGLRNYKLQVASAEEAIRRGTQNVAEAYMLIGNGYEQQMMFAEAVEAYKKAVTARPDHYDPYRRLAEGYRALANFDEAIETSRRALRLFPTDGAIYTDISWYYSLADRHQDAVDAAQAGIRFQPESHMAYTNLCRAYNDLKRHDMALTACNTALKLKPNDGETLFYLARANRALGRTAEANRQVKQAVAGLEDFARANPAYSDGFYLLGGAYYDDGQPKKALEAYQRTLELSPNFVKALYNVGIIHLIDGRKDLALQQHARLQRISPKYAAMLKTEIDNQ